MSFLHLYDPRWEGVRCDDGALAYEDDEIVIATDFEGATAPTSAASAKTTSAWC